MSHVTLIADAEVEIDYLGSKISGEDATPISPGNMGELRKVIQQLHDALILADKIAGVLTQERKALEFEVEAYEIRVDTLNAELAQFRSANAALRGQIVEMHKRLEAERSKSKGYYGTDAFWQQEYDRVRMFEEKQRQFRGMTSAAELVAKAAMTGKSAAVLGVDDFTMKTPLTDLLKKKQTKRAARRKGGSEA